MRDIYGTGEKKSYICMCFGNASPNSYILIGTLKFRPLGPCHSMRAWRNSPRYDIDEQRPDMPCTASSILDCVRCYMSNGGHRRKGEGLRKSLLLRYYTKRYYTKSLKLIGKACLCW